MKTLTIIIIVSIFYLTVFMSYVYAECTLEITTPSNLPIGVVGVAYSEAIRAVVKTSGTCVGQISWFIEPALPYGLQLSDADMMPGVIAIFGTPKISGIYTFKLGASFKPYGTDHLVSTTKVFNLKIVPPLQGLALIKDNADIFMNNKFDKLTIETHLNEIYNKHRALVMIVTVKDDNSAIEELKKLSDNYFRTYGLEKMGSPLYNLLILYVIGEKRDVIVFARSSRCTLPREDLINLVNKYSDKTLYKDASATLVRIIFDIKELIAQKQSEVPVCAIPIAKKNKWCIDLIVNGPPSKKIDITFQGENYADIKSFENAVKDEIVQFLDVDIFNKNKNKFNFRINTEVQKNGLLPLDGSASKCPTDVLVILDPLMYRAATDYRIIRYNPLGVDTYYGEYRIYINSLAHELGHVFGLLDEYTVEGWTNSPGHPNCAPDIVNAKKWWGDLESEGAGYHQGCSYVMKNIRPTYLSIMRSRFSVEEALSQGYTIDEIIGMAQEFGPVNERHIRKQLEKFSP